MVGVAVPPEIGREVGPSMVGFAGEGVSTNIGVLGVDGGKGVDDGVEWITEGLGRAKPVEEGGIGGGRGGFIRVSPADLAGLEPVLVLGTFGVRFFFSAGFLLATLEGVGAEDTPPKGALDAAESTETGGIPTGVAFSGKWLSSGPAFPLPFVRKALDNGKVAAFED